MYLGFLAHGFGLLRLPRIQEILGKNIENFQQSDIDPNEIPYSDSKKEAQRLKIIEEKVMAAQEKAKKKKKGPKNQRSRSRSEKREAKMLSMKEDFDVLGAEERIIKKIKKGKMKDSEVVEFLSENPHFKTFFRKKKH